jgi:hypothetical protein
LNSKEDASVADKCLGAIASACSGMGIRHSPPKKMELPDAYPGTFYRSLMTKMAPNHKMVLCIVPDDM